MVNRQSDQIIGGDGNVPTLQCTNQLSVDRRTVPLMPIRQCCLVRVSKDVVGGSVCGSGTSTGRIALLRKRTERCGNSRQGRDC